MSDNLAQTLSQHLAEATKDVNAVPGAIVTVVDRPGTLLFHQAAGKRQFGSDEALSQDALCWIASCTKLLTSIAALQLVEQGKLSLDEPIHIVVPQIKQLEGDYKTHITLRHLLTHTAGMSYPFFNHDTERVFREQGLASFGCTMASLLAPLNAEPGTRWEYGCSIDWAGLAVEAASGMDLDAYFKKFIFEPLGIQRMTFKPQTGLAGQKSVLPHLVGMNFRDKQTSQVVPQEHAIEQDESKIEVLYGGAGCYANAAEYVQILVALLNDGKHPKTGAQILTSASVEELFRDQLNEKLVKDLHRPIPDAQPEYTNPINLPGEVKQWCIAGLKTYDGPEKEHSFVWWAGIANHYWIINREVGYAAMIQSQIFPFGDPHVMGLFFGYVHPAVQAAFRT